MRALKLIALIFALYLPAESICAQEPGRTQQSAGPAAPLGPLDNRINNSDSGPMSGPIERSEQIEPDSHTLSGAETLGLGYLRSLGHIVDPSAFVSESVDSGTSTGKPDWATSVGGSLNLGHFAGHQLLALSYNGGASLYRGSTVYNQQFHNLGFSEDITWKAWAFRLGDSLMFASQGSFFGGFDTGGSTFGAQGSLLNNSQYSLVPGLQPGLAPLQTINTGIARRLGNTTFAEIDGALTRRSTVTFEGSYGLIHFLNAGYVNGVELQGRAGYNYTLGPKNMVAVFYDYERSTFGGTSLDFEVQSAQFSYGRTLVGRLAWQLGGGPAVRNFQNYGSLGGNRFSWNLYSGLTYNTRKTLYSFAYSHGTTLGSGVFFGATTDDVTASMSRPLTRYWSLFTSAGYARNSSLLLSSTFSNLFNNWYADASVGRQLGQRLNLNLVYGFQQQNFVGLGSCPVLSCGIGSSPRRHLLTVNLSWHFLNSPRERSGVFRQPNLANGFGGQ